MWSQISWSLRSLNLSVLLISQISWTLSSLDLSDLLISQISWSLNLLISWSLDLLISQISWSLKSGIYIILSALLLLFQNWELNLKFDSGKQEPSLTKVKSLNISEKYDLTPCLFAHQVSATQWLWLCSVCM